MKPLPLVVIGALLLFGVVALFSFEHPAGLARPRSNQPAISDTAQSKISYPDGVTVSDPPPSTNPALTERVSSATAAGHSNPTQQAEGLVSDLSASEGPIAAQVLSSAGRLKLVPNTLGLFPRVNIALEEKVEVAVAYAEAQPGDLVVVQAEDGGVLDQNRTALQARLDAQRMLRFAFKSTREGGIYRVTLRRGFEEKRLEFWGGTEPVAGSN